MANGNDPRDAFVTRIFYMPDSIIPTPVAPAAPPFFSVLPNR